MDHPCCMVVELQCYCNLNVGLLLWVSPVTPTQECWQTLSGLTICKQAPSMHDMHADASLAHTWKPSAAAAPPNDTYDKVTCPYDNTRTTLCYAQHSTAHNAIKFSSSTGNYRLHEPTSSLQWAALPGVVPAIDTKTPSQHNRAGGADGQHGTSVGNPLETQHLLLTQHDSIQ